jgi:hypothetical protein
MARILSFNKWDGGMVCDPREPREDVALSAINFDNYTHAYKMAPFRSMVGDVGNNANENYLDPYGITFMTSAGYSTSTNNLYGLGVVNRGVDSHVKIYMKVVNGGSTASYDPTTNWGAARGTSTAASTFDTSEPSVGMVFHRNYFYGANTGSTAIWKYGDISSPGSETFTDIDTGTSGYVPTAPGLVHSKDGKLYFPVNSNQIMVNTLGTWALASITFPPGAIIASICEHGNFLAIATNQPNGSCVIYLWDRDSSLSTFSDKIDWGQGSLNVIGSIAGVLVGVSNNGGTSASIEPRLYVKYYSGSQVMTVEEFICNGSPIISPISQVYNNLFYFMGEASINNTTFRGVWRVYKNSEGRFVVSFDRSPRNDTTINTATLHGFYRWGDYMFISYGNPANSDAYTIWRTDNNSTYTATSVYETTVNPTQPERYRMGAGMRSAKKSLTAVALGTEPLTSGQQAVLKYRVDSNPTGSWTTVLTATYNASNQPSTVVHEATFANGVQFQQGREYEFRIESTGGAVITELKYKIEELETQM